MILEENDSKEHCDDDAVNAESDERMRLDIAKKKFDRNDRDEERDHETDHKRLDIRG